MYIHIRMMNKEYNCWCYSAIFILVLLQGSHVDTAYTLTIRMPNAVAEEVGLLFFCRLQVPKVDLCMLFQPDVPHAGSAVCTHICV